MEKGALALEQAKHGSLKPSKVSKGLKSLDKAAENPVSAPFVRALMFLLYWVAALGSLVTGTFWGVIHALHLGLWYSLTMWRARKCVDWAAAVLLTRIGRPSTITARACRSASSPRARRSVHARSTAVDRHSTPSRRSRRFRRRSRARRRAPRRVVAWPSTATSPRPGTSRSTTSPSPV